MNLSFLRTGLMIVLITSLHYSCSSTSASLLGSMAGNAQLSGISTLLKSAGGFQNITGKKKGPFTLLAPTNNALSTLGVETLENLLKPENKEMLKGFLKKYILSGKYNAVKIKAGGLKDIEGNILQFGDAHITESIPTKGGQIHVIDKVIQ
jgi:uncharacterized surface protein with fasciclin (FAS1) repeats